MKQDRTGLYYYGARYYDPEISMWISVDPAINKYLPDRRMREEDIYRLPGGELFFYQYMKSRRFRRSIGTLQEAINIYFTKNIHFFIIF